jgi:AAA family ATPase
LLYGSPGTGKTLIAKYIASKLNVHLCVVTAASVFSKVRTSQYVGEAEGKVKDVFEEARTNSPAIIFIDEVDSICPSRDKVVEEYQRRIVAALLTEMDSINSNFRVLVMGTSNRPNAIDNALRRPGRLDKEIEIPVPSLPDRLDILKLVSEDMQRVALTSSELEFLAENTHGCVGADLVALCREAGLRAVRRARRGAELEVTFSDFTDGLAEISPSSLRDVMIEVPKVYWRDIGGYAEAKLKLRQAVEWPLKHPEAFERLQIKPPKGVMLYGPPGCSKTMMAKAIATESRMNFLAIKGPELFSKYVGDSERAIRDMFRKARTSSPCVLFIDELDSIGSQREGSEVGVNERVLCTLLNELDGIEVLKDVVVLAATNRPELIDKALIRPGRFDRLIYIPPPDAQARLQILQIVTSAMPLTKDVDLDLLVSMMQGFSGAEIVQVPREAGVIALSEDIQAHSVSQEHFQLALGQVRPNITQQMLSFYEDFARGTGR